MFEINSKPKSITIQIKSKNGLWTNIATINAHIRKLSYEEVCTILDSYSSLYGSNCYLRVINEYKKTIISTKSSPFCEMMDSHDIITVKASNETEVKTFIKSNNDFIPNMREFQKLVARHGGILKWVPYRLDASDNFLICGRLILHDKTTLTVAFH